MSIIRTHHNRENPYCILNKASLWDPNLSLEAAGLWARLISRPDDWQVSLKELCRSCRKGKDKIQSLINELIDNGYAYRFQRRGSGKFAKVEYLIFEIKMTPLEIQEILPQPDLPCAVAPRAMEPPLLSTNSTNSSPPYGVEEETKIQRAPRGPLVCRAPDVEISEEEHKKLVAKHGEEKTQRLYQELSDWKERTPRSKWKFNDYLSILKWVVGVLEDKEKKNPITSSRSLDSLRDRNEDIGVEVKRTLTEKAATVGIRITLSGTGLEFYDVHTRRTATITYLDEEFESKVDKFMRVSKIRP